MSSSTSFNKPTQATKNQEATVYVGNLDEKMNEALLWELFVQVGPVVHVHIPRDRINQVHQGYGFVEYQSEADADYAVKVMNQIKLFSKPIRVNKATADKKSLDVGANLFIGNLAPDVDEKLLYDTFSAFGVVVQTPKVARDADSGGSKGYGFVSYDNFESADAAIESMNGQFLCNKPITVSYAFKKDGKGERHGSAAERLLAAQSKRALGTLPTAAGANAAAMVNPMMGMSYAMPGMSPNMPMAGMPYYPQAAPMYTGYAQMPPSYAPQAYYQPPPSQQQ